MKKLMLINDNTAAKISYYHLVLLMFSLPFDRFYTHLIITSFVVHTFIHLQKVDFKGLFTWDHFNLQVVFFITLMSAFYSANKMGAINELGKQFTILLLPMLFYINKLDFKKYRNNIFTLFSCGCVLTLLYLYFQTFYTLHYYRLPLKAIFSAAFTNHNFSEPLGIHATYYALLLSIAFVYFLSLLVNENRKLIFLILLISCTLLILGIVQLSSKAILISVFIIIIFLFPFFMLKGIKRYKFIVLAISTSCLLVLGIYKIDSFKERYITALSADLNPSSSDPLSDPRLARWEIALTIIKKSPIIGHGSGTEIGLLRNEFYGKKFYQSFLAKLNSHNQYLSFLITAGIIGLLVYLFNLYFGFKLSLIHKDILFFSFMVLITIVSFSENILYVDKGITIYSLFFSLFYFSYPQKQVKKIIA